MRARYIPGQGFEVEGADQERLSYDEAASVSPLFEADLYRVLVDAHGEPWTWKEGRA